MSLLFLLFAPLVVSEEAGALTGITSQHNYYRCLHGSPFLKWDDDLQASAEKWAAVRGADSCTNIPSGGIYGENILWSHATSRAGKKAADAWYQNNQLNQNGQFNPIINDVTATFNQIIWRNSIRMGCAIVTCPSLQDELIVCHYDAPGNVFSDADAKTNLSSVTRRVPECQTIADGHMAGMFVSEETDETNPAAIAVGACIGSITTILIGALLFVKREGWKKWTSARLANQQPLMLIVIQLCLQVTVFALMVRSIQKDVPWCTLPDGSTFNPGQICFERTANSVPGASCIPYTLSSICSHEFICPAEAAPATAIIFIIIACVFSWFNIICEAAQAIPRVPFDPRMVVPVAVGSLLAQLAFVWITLWFMGGYIVSYLSLNGFAMAAEGSIELIVCLPLFFPMLVICSAQLTLNTK